MPFSNVIAEREFSAFKLIKTDRNPLHILTVCSLLRIKHWGSNEDNSASTVVIPKAYKKSLPLTSKFQQFPKKCENFFQKSEKVIQKCPVNVKHLSKINKEIRFNVF
jgi:hypothetical protein